MSKLRKILIYTLGIPYDYFLMRYVTEFGNDSSELMWDARLLYKYFFFMLIAI